MLEHAIEIAAQAYIERFMYDKMPTRLEKNWLTKLTLNMERPSELSHNSKRN